MNDSTRRLRTVLLEHLKRAGLNRDNDTKLIDDVVVHGKPLESLLDAYIAGTNITNPHLQKSRRSYLTKLFADTERMLNTGSGPRAERRCMACKNRLKRAPMSQFYAGESGWVMTCTRCDTVVESLRAQGQLVAAHHAARIVKRSRAVELDGREV